MKKLATTFGLVLVLVGLGAADALLTEGGLPERETVAMEPDVIVENPEPVMEPDPMLPPEGNSSSEPVQPAVGVRKTSGPNVEQVISELEMEAQPTDEISILSQIIAPGESPVQSWVILKDGDRAAFLTWTETPKVKVYFLALKEALHTSFSPQLKDLLDETQKPAGLPPRNLLTFFDTGISSERLVFVRVRERLYEIHVAEGMEDTVFELVEALSQ